MIISTAATTQMTSDIPDSEVELAKKIVAELKDIESKITAALLHLDGLYLIFKAVDKIPVDETVKNRVNLRNFRNQVIKNFNKVLLLSESEDFKNNLEHFSTDGEISGLISSFEKSLEDVKKQVNLFLKLFSSLSAVDFKDRIIVGTDNIKKQCAQLNQLINDRFVLHIEENIINGGAGKKSVKSSVNKEKEELINKLASFNQF